MRRHEQALQTDVGITEHMVWLKQAAEHAQALRLDREQIERTVRELLMFGSMDKIS